MHLNGTESVNGGDLPGGLAPPRKRKSKAEIEAENAAAIAASTVAVKCEGCGHKAKVALPNARRHFPLTCRKCGGAGKVTDA